MKKDTSGTTDQLCMSAPSNDVATEMVNPDKDRREFYFPVANQWGQQRLHDGSNAQLAIEDIWYGLPDPTYEYACRVSKISLQLSEMDNQLLTATSAIIERILRVFRRTLADLDPANPKSKATLRAQKELQNFGIVDVPEDFDSEWLYEIFRNEMTAAQKQLKKYARLYHKNLVAHQQAEMSVILAEQLRTWASELLQVGLAQDDSESALQLATELQAVIDEPMCAKWPQSKR